MCFIYIYRFQPTEKHKYRTEHSAGLHLLSAALADRFRVHIPEEALPDEIRTGLHGKPELTSYPDIHFNISHCEDIAVCALGGHEVGVDTEQIRPFTDSVIRKALTAGEQEFLKQMSTDDRSHWEWFFRLWTLKESRIKHSGMGLSMALDSFSFQYNLDTHPYEIRCSDPDLYFHQQILDGGYILSVCTSVPGNLSAPIYIQPA